MRKLFARGRFRAIRQLFIAARGDKEVREALEDYDELVEMGMSPRQAKSLVELRFLVQR